MLSPVPTVHSTELFNPGFHMSGKSQTMEDFALSLPSQILKTPSIILDNRRMTPEKRECFYFSDASQMSPMVDYRHMRENINVGYRGGGGGRGELGRSLHRACASAIDLIGTKPLKTSKFQNGRHF